MTDPLFSDPASAEPVNAASASPAPSALDTLIETVAKLRAPDGCPWDADQTHESLVQYLICLLYTSPSPRDRS